MITETKERANELVDTYRIILMNTDTDCGEEILCTMIAKQCALIDINNTINELKRIRINLSPGSYVSYEEYKRDINDIQQDAIAKLLFLEQVKRDIEDL